MRLSGAGATLSDLALVLVDGCRADAYGLPADNLSRIGVAWASILGLDVDIPAWKVGLLMAALKIVRAANQPDDDSLIDAVGYLEIVRRTRG